MTITAIRPKIYASETPKLTELFQQRSTLLKQLSDLDRAIIEEALKTPAYAFIKGISGGGSVPTGIIEPAGHIAYELSAYSLDQRMVKQDLRLSPAYTPTASDKIAQLGEKTINSLLNGKALTPEEKRKLVVAMLPTGILDGKEPEPSQPSTTYNGDDHPF